MTARIDRIWPDPADNLTDEDLLEPLRSAEPRVRVNFVSSVDGAATRGGLSGGLSGAADQRHFELLRRAADVVLVGAGTVRAEGYGPLRVSDASARWRRAHGLPDHPVFAILSRRGDLDPESAIFADAPSRPVVITSAAASGIERFAAVADVIVAGEVRVDIPEALAALRERGFAHVLCEGGPTLFGTFIAVDAVDELFITISPSLQAGEARRIAHGPSAPLDIALAHVLRSGDTLLLRYTREAATASRSWLSRMV